MSHENVTTTLVAPDISCAHCVQTVQQAVGDIEGVANVEARADTKQVVVTFDPQAVEESQIRQALDEAGYPVTSI